MKLNDVSDIESIASAKDTITIEAIPLEYVVLESSQATSILISVSSTVDTHLSGAHDEVEKSIDYYTLWESIRNFGQNRKVQSLEGLGNSIILHVASRFPTVDHLSINVTALYATAPCFTAGYRCLFERSTNASINREYAVEQLEVSCIIGVYEWERSTQQQVLIDAKFYSDHALMEHLDYLALSEKLRDATSSTSFRTLEALAAKTAATAFEFFRKSGLSITQGRFRLTKPGALGKGQAFVEIVRKPEVYPHLAPSIASHSLIQSRHNQTGLVVLSIGSNISPRFEHINKALCLLEKDTSLARVLDTSFMYESEPMYVTEQAPFANCACLIESNLSPSRLLNHIKEIEKSVGRVDTFRNGPRVVDLDIVFYDDMVMDNRPHGPHEKELILPHPRMQEREFVLRPIADIVPTFVPPNVQKTVIDLLADVQQPDQPIRKVVFFRALEGVSERYWPLGTKTYLMATLNTTPDSFSDGGAHYSLDDAMRYAHNSVKEGADIIDVGGYSTRPGAADISPSEEIDRIVPVIRRMRREGITLPISIDTFRASVANAALNAGADVVNDVRAFRTDSDMPSLAVESAIPVILMHSRGDAGEEKSYQKYGSVTNGVRQELGEAVVKVLETMGMRRWNVIVDPGIGFSKTLADNLTLLRDHRSLTSGRKDMSSPRHHSLRDAWEYRKKVRRQFPMEAMPTLIGASRKSFLSRVINDPGRPPIERNWATAGAVAAAVQQGADIVRVHDVKEMRDVKMVGDALWRVMKRAPGRFP